MGFPIVSRSQQTSSKSLPLKEFPIKQTGVMTVATTGRLQKVQKFSATAGARGCCKLPLRTLASWGGGFCLFAQSPFSPLF